MISGIFHQGSGLGNQLFRYVATRTLAMDKELEFGMCNPQLFKGDSFMKLDMGKPVLVGDYTRNFFEKKVVEEGIDIRGYDPEINFVEDKTIIDGEFQDERYWKHTLGEMRAWLAVEPLAVPDDVCIIGFRGGEYTIFPDLFLTKDYWREGIERMRAINPKMRFEIHTDDGKTALSFFEDLLSPGEIRIVHHIGYNWRSVRYAKHLLIANSSFYILPALLNENVQEVIAPRYWARRNKRVWALPQNYYSDRRWLYI